MPHVVFFPSAVSLSLSPSCIHYSFSLSKIFSILRQRLASVFAPIYARPFHLQYPSPVLLSPHVFWWLLLVFTFKTFSILRQRLASVLLPIYARLFHLHYPSPVLLSLHRFFDVYLTSFPCRFCLITLARVISSFSPSLVRSLNTCHANCCIVRVEVKSKSESGCSQVYSRDSSCGGWEDVFFFRCFSRLPSLTLFFFFFVCVSWIVSQCSYVELLL